MNNKSIVTENSSSRDLDFPVEICKCPEPCTCQQQHRLFVGRNNHLANYLPPHDFPERQSPQKPIDGSMLLEREKLWEVQKRVLCEKNETLIQTLTEKERLWEAQRLDLIRRNDEIMNALRESENKLKVQHKALTERCEVLLNALETKYAEEKTTQKYDDKVISERVNINVGGTIFSTVRDTLLRNEFKIERWPLHSDGCYFVDRDPKYFAEVMAYMRTGHLDLEQFSDKERRRLRADFSYYQLPMPAMKQSFQWSAEKIGSGLALSNNNCTVNKSIRNTWKGVIGSMPVDSFSVRLEDRGTLGLLMIGFGKKENFRSNDPNYKFSGWFLYALDGTLWSPEAKVHSQAYRSEVLDGSVVTASFNRQSRTVSFQVDNDTPLVAFNCSDSVGELDELYPIVDMFDAPAQISIVTRH